MKSDDVSCYSDLGLIETSAHLSFSLIVCVFKIKNLAMKNIKKTEDCQLFKMVCSTNSYKLSTGTRFTVLFRGVLSYIRHIVMYPFKG